jgi:hypothetical protein
MIETFLGSQHFFIKILKSYAKNLPFICTIKLEKMFFKQLLINLMYPKKGLFN